MCKWKDYDVAVGVPFFDYTRKQKEPSSLKLGSLCYDLPTKGLPAIRR